MVSFTRHTIQVNNRLYSALQRESLVMAASHADKSAVTPAPSTERTVNAFSNHLTSAPNNSHTSYNSTNKNRI